MFAAHFSAFELQPLPDGASTILRMLAAQTPNWAEIALVAARDPALSLALLMADPLGAGELQDGLNAALRRRLERLGTDLLRAWLLGLGHVGNAPDETPDAALLRAECALHLAIETDYPRPDEAYLAGLWYGLPRSAQWIAGRRPTLPALVADCGLPASLADALELEDVDPIAGGAMHPLLTLLAAARRLAGADWQERIDEAAGLTGLESGSVVALRTDVGYILSGHAAYPSPPGFPGTGAACPPLRLADDPYRYAGMLGLLTAAFVDLDAATIRDRLAIACPLFGLHTPPVLLGCGEDGRLRPLLGAAAASPDLLIGELRLRLDDETSCIALGARSEQPCSHFGDGGPPGRSVADWQVARWLGQPGFQCVGGFGHGLGHPLFLAGGVAVLQEPQLVQLQRALFLQRAVLLRHLGLAFQLVEVGVELAQDVFHPREVLARVLEPVLGLAAALLVLGDTGRFLEEQAQFLGPALDDAADRALADDRVGTRAQAGAQEHVLHVAAAHRLVVDVVAAVAVARQHALDGDLAILVPLAAGPVVLVVEHQFHTGAAGRLATGGAVEDDVLHRLAAQFAGLGLAQHPAHRIHDVGLAATIGPHHAHQLAGQEEVGRFGKRLEAGEFDGVETHK